MKIFFLRLLFILLLVSFEFSFFDILFPQIAVPIILIASIVIWTLILGFPRVLYMVIPLTVFFDITSSGTLGILTLYAVLLAYATSFLSRRLSVEYRGLDIVLYALFASLASLGYVIFNFIFSRGSSFTWSAGIFNQLFLVIVSSQLLLSFFLSALSFPLMYWIIRRFETYISLVTQREILQMK